jgi:SP family xylose:H+ symportor-like MFS transporter
MLASLKRMIIATSTAEPPGGTRINSGYVWLISVVAALGGLLFGYDWVVIGGAKPFFEPFFGITKTVMNHGVSEVVTNQAMSGWANSCALLGCLLGSLVTGALSDKFGRKRLLILSALLFAGSSVLTGWASNFYWFVIWRMTGGVAIGMASNLSPMYIAEVAPAAQRGRLVAVNQLTIVIGILAAQVVNWWIAIKLPHAGVDAAASEAARQAWNNASGWRWMFIAVTAPSLLFFLGALLIPESPRWLVKNGMAARAREVLARIGGDAYAAAAVREIESTIAGDEVQHVRFRDLLEPRLVKILIVGVTLAVLQQWSGINSIFNYAEEIYKSAGYGISDIMFNIVITGAINFVFTLLAIGTVDRFGRRGLMLIGCAGIGLSHVLIGIAYAAQMKGLAVLVFTLCALGCYGMSLAPITWVLIAEIFPNRIRGAAISVAVSALWIACFILTFMFPILKNGIGMDKTFWLYAAICFAGFVFVYFRVPETKGKSLEQIEKELAG